MKEVVMRKIISMKRMEYGDDEEGSGYGGRKKWKKWWRGKLCVWRGRREKEARKKEVTVVVEKEASRNEKGRRGENVSDEIRKMDWGVSRGINRQIDGLLGE